MFFIEMERETGFEPATLALARQCSTTELFPHILNCQIEFQSPRAINHKWPPDAPLA